MEPELHETLERLHRRIEEQRLGSSGPLDPSALARRTALPRATVEALLRGETPDPHRAGHRVSDRLKAFTRTHLEDTGQTLPDLVSQVHGQLGISRRRARGFLNGKRTPHPSHLPRLAAILGAEGGAESFTAPPAQVLNRVLEAELTEPRRPATIEDVMRKHGVLHTDLRLHGTMAADQFEQFITKIIESLNPPTGDKQ
ncbi:hypothetical protein [Streptomyces sp. NPDC126514]|uniref:hypothetical protein n=1 Tax=Streptomyces sp. NPDC126514 TaxID=3155210 RepID=UPI003330BE4C